MVKNIPGLASFQLPHGIIESKVGNSWTQPPPVHPCGYHWVSGQLHIPFPRLLWSPGSSHSFHLSLASLSQPWKEWVFLLFLIVVLFETRFWYLVQAGLKLMIIHPSILSTWYYRQSSLHPNCKFRWIKQWQSPTLTPLSWESSASGCGDSAPPPSSQGI